MYYYKVKDIGDIMSRHSDIYNLIVKLYEGRRYKEVVNKVDKYINIGFKSKIYECNLKFLRAKSLRYLGRFDEAILELKELIKNGDDESYSKLELFYIYYFLNRYEEALNMLPELYLIKNKNISNYSLLIAELVMKKQIGMEVDFKRGTRSDYVKEQIVNYNEDKTIQHIKKHSTQEDQNKNHSRFKENINIQYLLECIKNDLPNNKKLNIIDVLEVHCFSVPAVGYDVNSICNYIKVVTIPNTTNVITVYPYSYIGVNDIDVLNCDLDKLFNKQSEEKKESRIDKFNARFNLK